MADLNGLLTVPYQPSGFGGQLNSMLAPPQPRARTLEEEYELLRSGMLPGDYAMAVQARSGEPQRFVNDLGQMYSVGTLDEARRATAVLHPDAPADARPTTYLTGDTPLGSELRLPSNMDARRSAPSLLQPGMPLFARQLAQAMTPGAAPAPQQAPAWRRPPEMLQPLANAPAPMQPGTSLATSWTPAVVRDERLSPAPAGRTEGPAPPVSRAPGVSVGGDVPTQPSQMAADALLRPAPQQSPLAGALSGLSPEQRTAAMLHVIKGDFGEVAKLLTDTPQARAQRAAADELGKATGQAQASLPQAVQSGGSMVNSIDAVLDDGNLDRVLGWSAYDPRAYMPYTAAQRGVVARIQQVQGQAFLQAFNALRGAGAISEREGAAAQGALARLADLGQTPADYRRALVDARREIASLVALAHVKAGIAPPQYAPHSSEVPQSGGGGETVGTSQTPAPPTLQSGPDLATRWTPAPPAPGARLKYNPATGQIE